MGDRIYGCDDCLTACPWNRRANLAKETRFHAKKEIFGYKLVDFLCFDEDKFRSVFAKSPIKRIKLPRFLRNVCVALGNSGDPTVIPELERIIEEQDELVREHAQWAIQQLKKSSTHAEDL